MKYDEPLSSTAEFLVLCLKKSRSSVEQSRLDTLYHELGFEHCWHAAHGNQIAPFVAHSLLEAIDNEFIEPEWTRLLEQNEARIAKLHGSLIEVVQQFASFALQWAIIENAGILFGSNLPCAVFSAGDFDLLVESDRWNEVDASFLAAGFEPLSRRGHDTSRREYKRLSTTGDTQWLTACSIPYERVWLPLDYNNKAQEWLQRRIASKKDPTLYVLSPIDALVWVAIHTSMHSYVRAPGLRLHVDVDRCVRDNEIDWDAFLAEVDDVGLKIRVFVSLSMAAGLLQTPIPDSVLRELYPGDKKWRQICGLLAKEGVCAEGTPKLPHIESLVLDALLYEGSWIEWAKNVIYPNERWLRQSFFSAQSLDTSLWQLHVARYKRALMAWRPQ